MASPSFIRDFAQAAEESRIDRLWAVDHLVLPQHTSSPYVLGRAPSQVADGWLSENLAPNFEMHTTLTWVSGHTTTIGLGTSVAVLPIRDPVLNARQLATLDTLSGGRLSYGVGIGWLREKASAMGMPRDHRRARSEEHIAVLRALWCSTDACVEFHGRFYDFAPMDPRPVPTQPPTPVLVGGHSPAALDRAARIGDGWISAPSRPAAYPACSTRFGRSSMHMKGRTTPCTRSLPPHSTRCPTLQKPSTRIATLASITYRWS